VDASPVGAVAMQRDYSGYAGIRVSRWSGRLDWYESRPHELTEYAEGEFTTVNVA
jgi:hypothetical protein